MAEFVASKLAEAVVSQAVQRLTDLLFHEAASLSSVRSDVESMQSELSYIICFLKDADRKQEERNELVRKWVTEVRDVAFEIEDSVETYVFKIHSTYSIKAGFHLRKLRAKIEVVKAKLARIGERRQMYQIDLHRGDQGIGSNSRRSYPNEDEEDGDEVVSLKDSAAALKGQLMREEDRVRKISIVGMGGIGKTTLAKKVYNDVDVKKHFDCCAWVFISQQYVVRDVLCEIIIQVGLQGRRIEMIEKRDVLEKWMRRDKRDIVEDLIQSERERLKNAKENELIERLKRDLEDERYLVVFDDIWSIEAWRRMKSAFPKGKKGSKVVFTTRKKNVALFVDPHSVPIEPPLLTDEESWELLHQKAFPKGVSAGQNCSSEFEILGKEMAKKCGGLPLAIVMLGGLLGTKRLLDEWKKVQRNVDAYLNNSKLEEYGVAKILALSYHDLPYNLKPCFLYLGVFPEYWEIPKRKLIRLWIAEGFIPTQTHEAEETLEEVGERYLEELIDRCMVQVDKRDHTGIGVKTCRIHDRMRAFCIFKAKEDNFIEIVEHPDQVNPPDTPLNAIIRSRRIAVHLGSHFGMHQVHSQIRSLVWSEVDNDVNVLQLTNKKFRLLRVLELGSARLMRKLLKMPREVGNLVHLRYLGLRNAEISQLPNSLGKLRNLHTLDLRLKVPVLYSLTESASQLTRLRHLFLPDYRHTRDLTWSRCHFKLESLTNIQTLKHIRAEALVKGGALTRKLTNLQSLTVQFKNPAEVRLLVESQAFPLGRIRSLEMYMQDEYEFPTLKPLARCQVLSKLCLAGKISRDSSTHVLHSLPSSLTKLVLRYTEIKKDELWVLEKLLINLRFLLLGYDSCRDSLLIFSSDGFPKLETLQLFGLFKLENWHVERGSMPGLKRLDIECVPRLTMLPHGLTYVTSLQELNIIRMNRFRARLQVIDGKEGPDFYKVQHIPSISFLNTSVLLLITF